MVEPLRPATLAEAKAAHAKLLSSGNMVRTPLVRFNWFGEDDVEIYLKLECLQPIGSFKVRGAGNALASASPAELAHGVVTASAGNMAQGVAACAKKLGVPCTVVVPESAPRTKLAAVERLGGRVIRVPYDEWWQVIQTGKCPQVPDGYFVHPVLDQRVLAGNGTIALEIREDLPDADVILVPFGGGALASGIGSIVRGLEEADSGFTGGRCRVLAVEPASAAPCALSFERGEPCRFEAHRPSFVDGCGGKALIPQMWPVVSQVLDGGLAVELDDVVTAIRTLCERNRIVAEGAGACPVAAAMRGLYLDQEQLSQRKQKNRKTKVVCVVSGGGLDTDKLIQILSRCPASATDKPSGPECPVTRRLNTDLWSSSWIQTTVLTVTAAATAFILQRLTLLRNR